MNRFAALPGMKRGQGFTLIELMVTVVIIGVLAAIAYPSYTQYIVRANRAAAASFVLGLASKQEQYNLDARQYATTLAQLGYATVPTEVSKNYNVTIATDNSVAPPTYTITATPTGGQATRDTRCGNLTLNQAGIKGTVADCW
jgi:type IV pilus assembly protein PilE